MEVPPRRLGVDECIGPFGLLFTSRVPPVTVLSVWNHRRLLQAKHTSGRGILNISPGACTNGMAMRKSFPLNQLCDFVVFVQFAQDKA